MPGPREHEASAARRHAEIVERLPVRERLARVRDRRLEVDERHRAEVGDRAHHRVGRGRRRGSCPDAKLRTPSTSQYWASTGIASRMCSAAAPSITRARPRLELPRALPGRDDERRPAELRHPGLHRAQRAERRIQEQEPEHAAAQHVAARGLLERSRRARAGARSSAGSSSRQIHEALHRIAQVRERRDELRDVLLLEDQRRQQPDDVRDRSRRRRGCRARAARRGRRLAGTFVRSPSR